MNPGGKTKAAPRQCRGRREEGQGRKRTSEKPLMDKLLVSLTIAGIRIAPMLISFIMVLTTVLSYWDLYYPWLNWFFGTSYLSMACLYILSKTYRFCAYHRIFIWHAFTYNTVTLYDSYHPFFFDNFKMITALLVMSGIFFAGALWAHMKYGDRKAPDA